MKQTNAQSAEPSCPNATAQPLTAPGKRTDRNTRILFLLILYLCCFFIHPRLDNDIWFLLTSGRYVLQNGIAYIEPFTMHSNMQFVMQQWLSAVIFWSIYAKLGSIGLIALLFVMVAGIVTVTFQLSKLLSNGNFFAAFLAAFPTAALLSAFLTTRPMMFTLFFLLLELYFLEKYIASQKPAWLIPLPLISALMINLHAAMWPMLFVLLLPYFIDSFRFKFLMIEGQGYPKKYLLLTMLLMLAAGFLNPYGLKAMTYLFRSYGYTEIGMVLEMMPPDIGTSSGKIIFGTMFVVTAVYLFYRKGRTRLRYFLLTAGTAVLALAAVRSFVLFIACSFFPLAYYLRALEVPKGKIQTKKGILRLRAVLVALLACAMVLFLHGRYVSLTSIDERPTVSGAVNYLLSCEDRDEMVLYTGYNEGGYVEYMGLKPYIDPRAEVFVKENNGVDDIMAEYYQLQKGNLYYKDFLNKYEFTDLLLETSDTLAVYLPHDGDYRLVYEDDDYTIYHRIQS